MTNKRLFAVNGLVLWVAASAVVLVLLGWMLYSMAERGNSTPGAEGQELKVLCAAGIRLAMEPIAEQYEEEYGVKITFDFQGSGTLLGNMKVDKSGDLYLAADDSFIKLAKDAGLVQEEIPLGKMRPVILVQGDNPHNIQGIDDLLNKDVRVALGNTGQAAVGEKTKSLLKESGHWEQLEKQVTEKGTFLPTVNEIANTVKTGSMDAAIVWDATAAQYPKLKAIRAEELDAGTGSITIGVLTSSDTPTEALRFARYVGARDKGLKLFEKNGFEVVEGDVWEENPEITFFAGAVNQRALEPIIRDFQKREGVTVNTSFNGCGILTGTMKMIPEQAPDQGFPDIFMACDIYYLEEVQEWFHGGVNVSDTDIVIAVPKGNPKQIESLKDLAKPGVNVTLGQAEQCTIGVLTQHLLETEDTKLPGVHKRVMRNVVAQKPSSALLVPSITTKTADAALAYKTDCLAEQDKIDMIPIDSPAAKAIQPYSIAKTSQKKHLAHRLYEAIARSRDKFEAAGFNWRLDPSSP